MKYLMKDKELRMIFRGSLIAGSILFLAFTRLPVLIPVTVLLAFATIWQIIKMHSYAILLTKNTKILKKPEHNETAHHYIKGLL